MLESELFGHEAGAFTGAERKRVGRIEHAGGGTLFLDEIRSCPPAIRVKLLQGAGDPRGRTLGTNERRKLDLRVVAATKTDLGDPAARGEFPRGSLLPAERGHLADPAAQGTAGRHPLLFAHFLKRAADRFGRPVPEIAAAERDWLDRHDWPGNVRELLHFADRVALGLAPVAESLPAADDGLPAGSLPDLMDRHRSQLIRAALRRHGGDVRSTIEALGSAQDLLRQAQAPRHPARRLRRRCLTGVAVRGHCPQIGHCPCPARPAGQPAID